MFPRFLLDSDDDWQEGFRRSVYPWLHPRLDAIGEVIGVPLYATGDVRERQYVGTVDEDEEAIEVELDERGRRNPIACLKYLPDGRVSEGSWVLIHGDNPALIEKGMQLHITMFARSDGEPGRELYAHYEDDWRVSPIAHLRGKNYDVETGVSLATDYLNEYTYLVLLD